MFSFAAFLSPKIKHLKQLQMFKSSFRVSTHGSRMLLGLGVETVWRLRHITFAQIAPSPIDRSRYVSLVSTTGNCYRFDSLSHILTKQQPFRPTTNCIYSLYSTHRRTQLLTITGTRLDHRRQLFSPLLALGSFSVFFPSIN